MAAFLLPHVVTGETTDGTAIPSNDTGYPKRVKHHTGASPRITPPEEVRHAVSMVDDEPWAWFYDRRSHQFYVRRAVKGIDEIPNHFVPVGVVRAFDQGRYLDFAVPHIGADMAGVEQGQEWVWYVIDEDTLQLVRPNE